MKNKPIKIHKNAIISIVLLLVLFSLFLIFNNRHKKITPSENTENIETNIDYNNLKNASIVDGEKVNKAKKVKQEHIAIYDDDYSTSNLSITDMEAYSDSQKDASYLKATITNKGTEIFEPRKIQIVFLNNNNQAIASVYYFITNNINPEESIVMELYEIIDFTNAYDYEVKILS